VSLSNGERKHFGDVIQITSVGCTVDLIPVFGAQKDPQIMANNTLDVMITRRKTLDSAVMTTRAEKYH
jgi:hypothetical protein